jgi:hypothetical protein
MNAASGDVSFEDYVAMSGAAKAMGLPAMMAHYAIDMNRWTQISGVWNSRIPSDPARYGMFGLMVEQEGARISAGGAPRALGGGAPPQAPPQMQAAPPYPQQPGYPPAPGYPPPPPQPNFEQQAGQAANALGTAAVAGLGALGSAFSSLGNAVAGYTPGARCLVTWSDGQRYPATVVQTAQGQVLVAMGDGRQVWMPQAYVVVS